MNEIQYELISLRSRDPWLVRGMQCGHLAVRRLLVDEDFSSLDGSVRAVTAHAGTWAIDHVPSRTTVMHRLSEKRAMAIADGINIYSQHEPSSSNPFEAMRQVGDSVIEWAFQMSELPADDDVVPYRVWLGKHGN